MKNYIILKKNLFHPKEKIMSYSKEVLAMKDGFQVVFHSWLPEETPKACVVLSHGMTEFAFRYDEFAKILNREGIAFYAEDHRGHGETAALAEKNGISPAFGTLGNEGFMNVVRDVHTEIQIVKERNPGEKVFLIGHSFGSFIAQAILETYGQEYSGTVLMGTRGPTFDENISRIAATFLCLFGIKNKPSKLMDRISFGTYNNKIPCHKTQFDWLTKDEKCVEEYIRHPWCGFVCTGGFFKNLAELLCYIHKPSRMKLIPSVHPILLQVGDQDPVGNYSKSVRKLNSVYSTNGIKDLTLRVYEDDRHELLNETDKDQVINDTVSWILHRL